MPEFWFSVKRSLQCKSELSDVHDPGSRRNLSNIHRRKPCSSGCSRSISNLREVIHGSKRHIDKPPSCSPRSLGSIDFLNPITHEVVLSDAMCELKITGIGGNGGGNDGSTFVDTLKPGTPGPGRHEIVPHYHPKRSHSLSRKINGDSSICGGGNGMSSKPRGYLEADSDGAPTLICKRCGEKFKNLAAIEAHHLSNHAGNWP